MVGLVWPVLNHSRKIVKVSFLFLKYKPHSTTLSLRDLGFYFIYNKIGQNKAVLIKMRTIMPETK